MALLACLHLLSWPWQRFSMLIQWLASILFQNRDIWYPRYVCIYVLECILCLCYDLWLMQPAPILFKVLMLNVAVCIVRLHFSNFCLSSVGKFSNTEARAPTSVGRFLFFTRAKGDAFWTCGLNVGHSNLSMAVFILLYRGHPYRWETVVLRSN